MQACRGTTRWQPSYHRRLEYIQENFTFVDNHDEELDEGDGQDDTVAVRVYTDMVEREPEVETDIHEFEDTLPDGAVIKRRVIKMKQKQTIIKRVVMEGPEDELPTNEEEAQEMLKQVLEEWNKLNILARDGSMFIIYLYNYILQDFDYLNNIK